MRIRTMTVCSRLEAKQHSPWARTPPRVGAYSGRQPFRPSSFGCGFVLLPLLWLCLTPPHAVAASVNRLGLHDFGIVTPGSKTRHEFVLRNRSHTPLPIKALLPSCEWLQITLAAQFVPPSALPYSPNPASPCGQEWPRSFPASRFSASFRKAKT